MITGGSGFVGMAIAEALRTRGHRAVLFAPAPSPLAPMLAGPAIRFVAGDVRSAADLGQVEALGISHIVHGAAITPDAGQADALAERVTDVNVNGSRQIMELARRLRPRRVVQLSSVSVYGEPADDNLRCFEEENAPVGPQSLYGRTKLAAEAVMREQAKAYELPLSILRLGPVFGPWEIASGSRPVVSPQCQIMEGALRGEASALPRALQADWLYSRDLANWIVTLLLETEALPPVVNLGAGRVTSVDDWCRALQAERPDFAWGIDPDAATIRSNYRRDRPPLCTRRLDALLPERQQTALADTAADYLAWAAEAFPRETRTA
nr:NAD(P)-dependent oxidoreductase [Aurantimonas endophytica]